MAEPEPEAAAPLLAPQMKVLQFSELVQGIAARPAPRKSRFSHPAANELTSQCLWAQVHTLVVAFSQSCFIWVGLASAALPLQSVGEARETEKQTASAWENQEKQKSMGESRETEKQTAAE